MDHVFAFVRDALPNGSSNVHLTKIHRLALALKQSLNLPVGSRVGLLGWTSLEWIEILLACSCNGWIVVPFNYRWSLKDIESALNLVTPLVLFFDSDTAEIAHSLSSYPIRQICFSISNPNHTQTVQSLLTTVKEEVMELKGKNEDPALICFTSGSTGSPKGVTISHRSLCFQLMYKIEICGYASNDIYLHTAPLFHVGGLVSALAMIAIGAEQIFMKKFSATEATSRIQRRHVTALIAVPTMITDLANVSHPIRSLISVKKLLIGGGSLHPQQVKQESP